MTTEQAIEIFNAAIAKETDADKIAKLELVREFYTNKAFREALSDKLFNESYGN